MKQAVLTAVGAFNDDFNPNPCDGVQSGYFLKRFRDAEIKLNVQNYTRYIHRLRQIAVLMCVIAINLVKMTFGIFGSFYFGKGQK